MAGDQLFEETPLATLLQIAAALSSIAKSMEGNLRLQEQWHKQQARQHGEVLKMQTGARSRMNCTAAPVC